MLHALCDLAVQEELMGDDPSFEMKGVTWIVHLSANGRLLDLIDTRVAVLDTGEVKQNKNPKEEVLKILVPRQPGRSGRKAPPCFLVDNAKYVFGLPTVDKNFSKEEGAEKSAAFRDALSRCAQATNDSAVRVVLDFLQKVTAGKQGFVLPEKCKSNDLFAFRVEPEYDSFVHLRPTVREYWRASNAPSNDRAGQLRCLVTGQPMSEPELVPLIKKLPGAMTSGAAIVSFNTNAFESYGWKGNANAPISKSAATMAATALNRLLDPQFKRPDGKVMPAASHRPGRRHGCLLLGRWTVRRSSLRPNTGLVGTRTGRCRAGRRAIPINLDREAAGPVRRNCILRSDAHGGPRAHRRSRLVQDHRGRGREKPPANPMRPGYRAEHQAGEKQADAASNRTYGPIAIPGDGRQGRERPSGAGVQHCSGRDYRLNVSLFDFGTRG